VICAAELKKDTEGKPSQSMEQTENEIEKQYGCAPTVRSIYHNMKYLHY
jgi:hypothetical protein